DRWSARPPPAPRPATPARASRSAPPRPRRAPAPAPPPPATPPPSPSPPRARRQPPRARPTDRRSWKKEAAQLLGAPFDDDRRRAAKIAVTDPARPHAKIRDPGPRLARGAIGKARKV